MACQIEVIPCGSVISSGYEIGSGALRKGCWYQGNSSVGSSSTSNQATRGVSLDGVSIPASDPAAIDLARDAAESPSRPSPRRAVDVHLEPGLLRTSRQRGTPPRLSDSGVPPGNSHPKRSLRTRERTRRDRSLPSVGRPPLGPIENHRLDDHQGRGSLTRGERVPTRPFGHSPASPPQKRPTRPRVMDGLALDAASLPRVGSRWRREAPRLGHVSR